MPVEQKKFIKSVSAAGSLQFFWKIFLNVGLRIGMKLYYYNIELAL